MEDFLSLFLGLFFLVKNHLFLKKRTLQLKQLRDLEKHEILFQFHDKHDKFQVDYLDRLLIYDKRYPMNYHDFK
jgi:hypothetical protein